MKQIKKKIVIEGGDATGKSTMARMLLSKGYTNVFDRGLPTRATINGVPTAIPQDVLYIFLDIPVEVALSRIQKRGVEVDSYWHTRGSLSLYRAKYKELAGPFGAHFLDATGGINAVFELVEAVVTGKISRKVVNIDVLTEEEFKKFPKVVEGESKIVRLVNKELKLVVIKLKPTVYSYTHNRCGVIEDTDKMRAECTRLLLDPIRAAGVNHSFWRVNEKYILSDLIENPPPIEVVVKKYHVGTPKYRYYGMDGCKVRTDYEVKEFVLKNEGKYPKEFVRFDWRNPMYHPETKERLADEVICDEQADFHINVKNAKVTARTTFQTLQKHFNKCGVELYDICFFISEDGKTIFSEVSQDCGRYRKINDDGEESLDKDVWRAGGSSNLIGKKWAILLDLLRKNKWKEKEECTFKPKEI